MSKFLISLELSVNLARVQGLPWIFLPRESCRGDLVSPEIVWTDSIICHLSCP